MQTRTRNISGCFILTAIVTLAQASAAFATYLPMQGRWVQRDHIGTADKSIILYADSRGPFPLSFSATTQQYIDGMNLYQYVQSQPDGFSDPTGLSGNAATLVGLILSAIMDGVDTSKEKEDVTNIKEYGPNKCPIGKVRVMPRYEHSQHYADIFLGVSGPIMFSWNGTRTWFQNKIDKHYTCCCRRYPVTDPATYDDSGWAETIIFYTLTFPHPWIPASPMTAFVTDIDRKRVITTKCKGG